MNEIFKDIEGFEGLYQVSNLGRVKSLNYLHTGNERILKLKKNKDGYLQVNLYKEGNRRNFTIHRLVANAFIENPNNLPFVNHMDEDKTNNIFTNLEWCDAKYNCNYGTRNERVRVSQMNRKDLSKPVRCIETGIIYQSTFQAQRQTGVAQQNISSCCNGHRKTAGKLHWMYI